MMTSCPALKVGRCVWWVVQHLAVFSVVIPRSSASTCAATADGASPTTEPAPCEVSHARRSAFIAVVFAPPPAPPTHPPPYPTQQPTPKLRAGRDRVPDPQNRGGQ